MERATENPTKTKVTINGKDKHSTGDNPFNEFVRLTRTRVSVPKEEVEAEKAKK